MPKGAYYEEALRWAVSNDIIKGYEDGTFRPNIAPTRQEFASMLDRFVKLVQKELLPKEDAVVVNIDGTGDWARESVSKMLLTGVMTGIDGQFMPKKTTPRAEVAQIIKNLYDTINRSQGVQGIN